MKICAPPSIPHQFQRGRCMWCGLDVRPDSRLRTLRGRWRRWRNDRWRYKMGYRIVWGRSPKWVMRR